MKTLSQLVALFAVLTLLGCGTRSEPGGGQMRADEFTIRGPASTVSIPEGGTEVFSVSLDRGKDFKDTVKLQFDAPSGVEVAPKEATITAAQKHNVEVRVVVGKNVARGGHVIHVTGQPEHGKSTTLDIKLMVTEPSSKADNVNLKLRGPATATTIKQGESQTILISLEPNSKYQATVNLQVPKYSDVKAEFVSDTSKIKATEGSQARLRITADNDARIGEHIIRIDGDAPSANLSALDVKVNVIAK
jgi:uncharacterized membrane protein